MSTYNELLVKYGNVIYNDRKEYLKRLIPVFQQYYTEITRGAEMVNVEYKSQLDHDEFLSLANYQSKDLHYH